MPQPGSTRLENGRFRSGSRRYNEIDPELAKRALEQALAEREQAAAAARERDRRQALRADTLAAALAFAAAGWPGTWRRDAGERVALTGPAGRRTVDP